MKLTIHRVDFNVPLEKDGRITNTQRIDASLPTIEYALKKGTTLIVGQRVVDLQILGAKSVVLMSHLGRPDGQVKKEFTLAPVADILKDRLKRYTCI